jgi:N,N-dimethylformamidase
LTGYVDRFSAWTGERIAVKVSTRLAEPYRADLVQIIHGDTNPAGPGVKSEEVEATAAGTYPSRFQRAHSGSDGIVTRGQGDPCPTRARLSVRVQPWLPDARRQTVLAIAGGPTLWVTAESAGLTLGARESRVAAPMLQRRRA